MLAEAFCSWLSKAARLTASQRHRAVEDLREERPPRDSLATVVDPQPACPHCHHTPCGRLHGANDCDLGAKQEENLLMLACAHPDLAGMVKLGAPSAVLGCLTRASSTNRHRGSDDIGHYEVTRYEHGSRARAAQEAIPR
jgi:hypothetical protein